MRSPTANPSFGPRSAFARAPRRFASSSAGSVSVSRCWRRERFRSSGGEGALPTHAALPTFDDAWMGVLGAGLAILSELELPALCFVNMATVEGAPNLGAIASYERRQAP